MTRSASDSGSGRTADGTSSDEEQGYESDTRCVCKVNIHQGFMIQCDSCELWLHGRCVGLDEDDVPDNYYCEFCAETGNTQRLPYKKWASSFVQPKLCGSAKCRRKAGYKQQPRSKYCSAKCGRDCLDSMVRRMSVEKRRKLSREKHDEFVRLSNVLKSTSQPAELSKENIAACDTIVQRVLSILQGETTEGGYQCLLDQHDRLLTLINQLNKNERDADTLLFYAADFLDVNELMSNRKEKASTTLYLDGVLEDLHAVKKHIEACENMDADTIMVSDDREGVVEEKPLRRTQDREIVDCVTCGQPFSLTNYKRHIEQCFADTELRMARANASKSQGKLSLPQHLVNLSNAVKGASGRRVCGYPFVQGKLVLSQFCVRDRHSCPLHFGWESVELPKFSQECEQLERMIDYYQSLETTIYRRILVRHSPNG